MATRKRPSRRIMPMVEAASSKDTLEFIRSLQALREEDPKDYERRALEIVRDTKLGTLQSYARRIIMDLAKGPPYELQRPPDAGSGQTPLAPARTPRKRASGPRGSGGTDEQ